MSEDNLRDRVILVVEDEFLLAFELAESLRRAGAVVLGPAGSVENGMALYHGAARLDGAILDVNLGGELVFPLANCLSDSGVPLVFTTGYDIGTILRRYPQAGCCEKPVETAQVIRALSRVVRA
jgi:DNA-binding response OmpR family regulator